MVFILFQKNHGGIKPLNELNNIKAFNGGGVCCSKKHSNEDLPKPHQQCNKSSCYDLAMCCFKATNANPIFSSPCVCFSFSLV